MNARRAAPSPTDVAVEANSVLAGLGILLIQVAPLALPGLLLYGARPATAEASSRSSDLNSPRRICGCPSAASGGGAP